MKGRFIQILIKKNQRFEILTFYSKVQTCQIRVHVVIYIYSP